MSNNLLYDEHIKDIAARAKGKMFWVLETFDTRDKYPLIALYKSLVRPSLE